MPYRNLFNFRSKTTPQSTPIPGTVPNNAGGYAFPVDDWARLDRFLVLGSEGGTYYVAERALTVQNAEAVLRCLEADGARAVARIVAVSEAGRAPKNEPALLALALAAGRGDEATRRAALAALPRVARTGTHLFHFAAYVEQVRGWGRGLRRAVADWYNAMPVDRLALQAVKYQQRDGWSHRDLLRLAHPKVRDAVEGRLLDGAMVAEGRAEVPDAKARRALYDWMCRGTAGEALPPLVQGLLAARAQGHTPASIAALVRRHRLPREALPTEWLNSREVWEALLDDMPLTALVRNLGKMSSVGLLTPLSEAAAEVVRRLSDAEAVRRARLHPLALLLALRTYAAGRGEKGKLAWEPVPAVVDALDAAFYAAFQAVERTGRRLLLALDVSGSMGMSTIAGTSLTAREASAALALVTAATERAHHIVGFSAAGAGAWHATGGSRSAGYTTGNGLVPLPISPRQRLTDAVRAVSELPFGGTDCALPMLYALDRGLAVDAFVVLTDSETWAGDVHPAVALRRYRERMGIAAKLAVVGMVSNGFSIADPNDGGMLDVVGFDTATPAVLADFIRA